MVVSWGFNDKNTQPQDAEQLWKPRQASEVSSPTCQEFLICYRTQTCYIDGPRMMKYEKLKRRDLVEYILYIYIHTYTYYMQNYVNMSMSCFSTAIMNRVQAAD